MKYVILTDKRQGIAPDSHFAFEEDGIKYYAYWYGRLVDALHGTCLIDSIVYTNFEYRNN